MSAQDDRTDLDLRHPPSAALWRFCMARLRELHGPDAQERHLAAVLGFEHSRATRWKHGQMYVGASAKGARTS